MDKICLDYVCSDPRVLAIVHNLIHSKGWDISKIINYKDIVSELISVCSTLSVIDAPTEDFSSVDFGKKFSYFVKSKGLPISTHGVKFTVVHKCLKSTLAKAEKILGTNVVCL